LHEYGIMRWDRTAPSRHTPSRRQWCGVGGYRTTRTDPPPGPGPTTCSFHERAAAAARGLQREGALQAEVPSPHSHSRPASIGPSSFPTQRPHRSQTPPPGAPPKCHHPSRPFICDAVEPNRGQPRASSCRFACTTSHAHMVTPAPPKEEFSSIPPSPVGPRPLRPQVEEGARPWYFRRLGDLRALFPSNPRARGWGTSPFIYWEDGARGTLPEGFSICARGHGSGPPGFTLSTAKMSRVGGVERGPHPSGIDMAVHSA